MSLPDVPGGVALPVGGALVAAVGALWKKVTGASHDCDERIDHALAPLRRRIDDLEARCDKLVGLLSDQG